MGNDNVIAVQTETVVKKRPPRPDDEFESIVGGLSPETQARLRKVLEPAATPTPAAPKAGTGGTPPKMRPKDWAPRNIREADEQYRADAISEKPRGTSFGDTVLRFFGVNQPDDRKK